MFFGGDGMGWLAGSMASSLPRHPRPTWPYPHIHASPHPVLRRLAARAVQLLADDEEDLYFAGGRAHSELMAALVRARVEGFDSSHVSACLRIGHTSPSALY